MESSEVQLIIAAIDQVNAKVDALNMKFDTLATSVAEVRTQVKPLFSNGTPGIIANIQSELSELKKEDARRTWIERGVTGAIAVVFSTAITMHEHILKLFGVK